MHKPLRRVLFIVVFLGIALMPLLANGGQAAAQATPALDTPEIQSMSDPRCIESTEYMRAEHMTMLKGWRDEVVRSGATEYVSSSGQLYEMSLTGTCFSCHSNEREFCDSCHTYIAVEPDCWNCHVGEEVVGNS